VMTSVVISVVCFIIPALYPDCEAKTTIPNYAAISDQMELFTCPDGKYSKTASIFYASSYAQLFDIFHNLGTIGYWELAAGFAVYCCTACWTSGTAVPAGLFVPSLVMGAYYGRFTGEIMRDIDGRTYVQTMWALVGAVSFLSGTTRITVALVAIAVEAPPTLQRRRYCWG